MMKKKQEFVSMTIRELWKTSSSLDENFLEKKKTKPKFKFLECYQ